MAADYRRMGAAQYTAWLAAGGSLAKASFAAQAVSTSDVSGLATTLSGPIVTTEMGPGSPLLPSHPESAEPRRFDYQPGRNINSRPRAYEPLDFATLRRLCSSYDVARIAIEARKDEARGWDWDVRVKPVSGLTRDDQKARAASFAEDVARVKGFLESPNQEDDFGSWLMQYLEDLFVVDAPCLYLRPTRGGNLYAAEVIDGSTIQVLVDAYGRQPKLAKTVVPRPHQHIWIQTGDGAVCSVCEWPSAYQQVIRGVPWTSFAAYEMLYIPYHQSADSPYGTPPVYWVLMAVNRALRRQSLDLSLFTEGTMPPAFYRLPEGWTTAQALELQELWDALLAGDDVARARLRFIPGGNGAGIERMNPEPRPEVETWLMHVTAAAFGTSAYELGFEPDSGLGGAGFGDASRASAEKRGSKPLSRYLAGLLNRIIAIALKAPELEFVWRGLGETADQLKEAQRDEIRWKAGAYATDEWREDHGLDAIGLGPSVYDPKIGVVLVSDLLANAAATAGAAAALAGTVLDPTGQTVLKAEAAGAAAAEAAPVPSSAPNETTVGQRIGTPATPIAKASAAGDLAAWERKAIRALKLGRDATRFSSDAIDPATLDVLRNRLRKASTTTDVRAAFAGLAEVTR